MHMKEKIKKLDGEMVVFKVFHFFGSNYFGR